MYSKRAGMSGIRGALYETKLLSLLYFRTINDDDIEEFQIASNIDNIGAFDDICFKAKVKGFKKPIAVFIQAKHTINEKKKLQIDLASYFSSYMKIRQLFHPSNNDLFFRGTFDETECLFVIYTTATVDLSDDSVGCGISDKLHYLIGTGGTVKQPDKNNIEYLAKLIVKDQVTSLAERIAEFITEKRNVPMMMTDEYVLRYHVILARQVLDVSEIQPDGYRIGSFRKDFFDTNEEHLILFKDTLFKEILKKPLIKPDDTLINNLLFEYFADPADVTKLSKLVGTVITYNNGQLEFNKQYVKEFRPDMKPIKVSQSTVNEAVELAAKEILLSLYFKVPAPFGNKDLTLMGSDAKIERRINYLTTRFNELLERYKSTKMVTIDDSLGAGFLQLNGGIAGGIGNIFVLDDNTKLMKITDNWESLGTLAKRLYTELNSENHNLQEYKFCIKVDKFPKLSFDCIEYEENLARDFLNKLLYYCNQANEKAVEEILKDEIEDYQHNQPNYFQVKADAIFSKYHDVIQEWWSQPQQSWSLTRESDLFRRSINNIIQDPLTSSINLTYMHKLQQYNYTFTEDAVSSLNLQYQYSSTVIVAENSVLTVIKVMQHLKNKDFVVLDLEYIANLPTNDRNALRTELTNINIEKVLILVCDKVDSRTEIKTLEDIAGAVRNKTTIIITNQTTLEVLHKHIPKSDNILHDKKLSLTNMSNESQKRILDTATAIFPGVEIRLELLLKGWPMASPRSVGTAVASAVADEGTVTGSHRIGDERKVMKKKVKSSRPEPGAVVRTGTILPPTPPPT